jgi:hypothetical protein
MAASTKIAWAHSTFNPWTGCSAVSAACDHCYARDQWAARTGRNFSERRRTTASYWSQARKWDAEADKFDWLGYQWMHRVGKAAAGHLLDGVEHMAIPEGW